MNANAAMVIAPPDQGERRFLIRNLTWEDYEALLGIFDEKGIRITYDRGSVELTAPMIEHERYRYLLGRMVDAITEELDIPMVGAGSTTFKSELLSRGLEPDACYYLTNAIRLRKVPRLDPAIDPPPDLAIEVEITSPLLPRLGIYAALGVPEVWKHDGEGLSALILGENGVFSPSETSLAFPFLRMAELARFLSEYDATNDTRWARGFRAWVREVVVARFDQDRGERPGA